MKRRGRPPARTDQDLSNPRFIRFRAALDLEEAVYDLVQQVLNSRSPKLDLVRLAAQVIVDLYGADVDAVTRRIRLLVREVKRAEGSPNPDDSSVRS